MTQTDDVLALLRQHGEDGLTPLEALDQVGTYRLAARISDAKAIIPDDEEIVTLRYTTPGGSIVARYVLRKRPTPDVEQTRLW